MYVICRLVYGVRMNDKLMARMRQLGHNDFDEDDKDAPTEAEAEANIKEWDDAEEPWGFTKIYTGGEPSYPPAFLGIELHEFDECNYGTSLSSLKKKGKVTPEIKATFEDKFAKLRPDLKALCGKPRVWIIWDHS